MSTTTTSHQVADGVFAGTGTDVNWALVQDGTDLTLIDAGWPGDAAAVERSIRSLGRRPQDVRAVVLTHAHADHTGALEYLHETYGVPVYAAADELPNAQGRQIESAGPLDVVRYLSRPRAIGWAARIARAGGLEHHPAPYVQAFTATDRLDLPGSPVPVPTPGHTSGHTSFLLPGAGVVVTGDALVTAHPTARNDGPQLLPAGFTHDQTTAIRSLHELRELAADVVVPGHGPVWRGAISEAVHLALAQGRSR